MRLSEEEYKLLRELQQNEKHKKLCESNRFVDASFG
jgi:hypothetical protein